MAANSQERQQFLSEKGRLREIDSFQATIGVGLTGGIISLGLRTPNDGLMSGPGLCYETA